MKISKKDNLKRKTIFLLAETPQDIKILEKTHNWIEKTLKENSYNLEMSTEEQKTFVITSEDIPDLVKIVPEINGKKCFNQGISTNSKGEIDHLTLLQQ